MAEWARGRCRRKSGRRISSRSLTCFRNQFHGPCADGGVVPTLRHLHKSAASPLLQQTISTFVDYEKTVTSTAEMLSKIEASMGELESSLAQVQATVQRPGPDG